MYLRLKQDITTQKRIGGKELDTKGRTPCLEGTMTLEEDKPCDAPTLTSSWRGPTLPKR
jgi:hypothetical protein